MAEPLASTPGGRPPDSPSSAAAGPATAVAAGALFFDAAIETFAAGSAVRWWTIGAAILYAGVTALTWRRRVGWQGRLTIGVIGMLGLAAATAWAPGGLTDGIRLVGQPTGRVLAVLVAAGIGLAGVALVRTPVLPLAAKIGVGVVAAYSAGAFLAGAIANTPMSALLGGQSFWQALPRVLQGAFIGAFVVLPIGLVWSVARAGLRRPRAATWRAELWRGTAIAASLATVLAGLPLRSGGSPSAPPPAEDLASRLGIDPTAPKLSDTELETALTNSLRAIEDGERDAPRDRWDPAWVAAQLGSDPARLFTWVQQNTFWIPYRGLLRGPIGVLMDRLGNNLDRASLLAILLRNSGRRVRFARGSLSDPQAMQALRQLLVARYSHAPTMGQEEADPVSAVSAQYQLDETAVRRTLVAQIDVRSRHEAVVSERVPDQTRRLATHVGPGPAGSMGDVLGRAVDILKDHWWVQVEEGSGWRDFDLLASSIGTSLTAADQMVDLEAFPAEMRHQVTVRVITEQWTSGGLKDRVALESVLRPSQIIGMPVALRFMPNRWPSGFPSEGMTPEQALRALALDQHAWTATLAVDRKAVIQAVIRDTGDLAPPSEAGGAGAIGGAFRNFDKRLDDALGPPASPASSQGPGGSSALTSAWIEYELQQPGEQPQRIRRAVFDLIGPAARAARPTAAPRLDDAARLARGLALLREVEILPLVSRFGPDFVTHLAAQSVLANRAILTEAMRDSTTDDFAHVQDLAKRLAPPPSPLYALALARFEWSRTAGLTYLESTNILTRHTFFAADAAGLRLRVATDIVANQVGVDVAAEDPFSVRLEQGVLDTNAEAILASAEPDASNAGSAFADSRSWTTLRGPGDPQLDTLGLAADVQRRIADDLAGGYLVVAPRSPVNVGAGSFQGYWRVDPKTGQTLGIGSAGYGQEMAEYLIGLVLTFELTTFFYYFFCRLSAGPGSSGACKQAAIEQGVLAVLLSVFMFLAPAMGIGMKGAGGIGKGSNASPAGKEPGAPGGGSGPGPGSGPGGGPNTPGGQPPPKSAFDIAKAKSDAAADKFEAVLKNAEKESPVFGFQKPEVQQALKEAHEAAMELLKVMDGGKKWKGPSPGPSGPGQPPTGPGGTQVIPPAPKSADPNAATLPGTGPGGTQIIPPAPKSADPNAATLPGTGPGGTQIIPPAPKSADPNAATLPGTGPGGTQIIPPGPKCPGPACPPTAQQKTLTGLGGVANALGQKIGG